MFFRVILIIDNLQFLFIRISHFYALKNGEVDFRYYRHFYMVKLEKQYNISFKVKLITRSFNFY